MLHFDTSFRIIWKPKDEDFQDYCSQIKTRMLGILWDSERHIWTIVLCAHNEELYLPWTLASIAKLQTQEKVRVIVVDNNSTDRTRMIIEACWTEVISEKKKWLSYARQAWLENASWEFVFSTDADVRVPPLWIDWSLAYFWDNPWLVGISGWIEQSIHPLHRVLRQIPLLIRKASWLQERYFRQNFSWGNTIYRREAAISAWGYKPWFDLWEDWLIGKRLSEKGEILVINDDPNIDVQVSPRRVDTTSKVLELYTKWFFSSNWLNRSRAEKNPMSFKDIR